MHLLNDCTFGLVDILAVAESKLDDSFPDNQFILPGYKKPLRLDVNGRSGGLLVYVNDQIPSRRLNTFVFDKDIQVVPFELNLRKTKWVIFAIYRPPKQDLSNFLNILSIALDFYNRNYDNLLIIGDFNAEPQEAKLKSFLDSNNIHNHMKRKTCWKSPKGSCIDLILSNKKSSLQHTGTMETGISDHHMLIYTMLKTHYVKFPPKKISYRNYTKFDKENFLNDLRYNLSILNIVKYNNFQSVFTPFHKTQRWREI